MLRHYFQRHEPAMTTFALAADRVALASVVHVAALAFAWAHATLARRRALRQGWADSEQSVDDVEQDGLLGHEPAPVHLGGASWRTCLVYGVLKAGQDVFQLASVVFANANYVACVSMLFPFLNAWLVRLFRVETAPYPALFWPAVSSSAAALLLIVNGPAIQALLFTLSAGGTYWSAPGAAVRSAAEASESMPALGIGLGFAGIICGALSNVLIKATGEVRTQTLMSYSLGVEALLLSVVAFAHLAPRGKVWCVWPAPTCSDWRTFALLLAAAWGNLYLYGLAYVYLARTLGPTLYVSFSSVAPVGTAFWSGVFLKEPLTSAVSWVGLGALILTSCVYFQRQLRGSDAPP